MSRRAVPDPTALLTVVAGRVDGIERDLGELRQDVTALGRGLADLLAQVRTLTQPPTPTGAPSRGSGHAPDDAEPLIVDGDPDGVDVGDAEDEEEGQRDWLTVSDPQTAEVWLGQVAVWAEAVLAVHGLDLSGVPCWPLHPPVVVDLLALSAQRDAAYPQPEPTPVVEWLTRWLPAGIDRITTALAECRQDHAHRHAEHLFDAAGLTSPQGLADVAVWWTTARDTSPGPAWLHLPAAA